MNHCHGDLNIGTGKEIKVRFPLWLIPQPSIGSDGGDISFYLLVTGTDQAPLLADLTQAWMMVST